MATVTAPIRMTSRGRVAVIDLVIENAADNMRALATVEKLMCRNRTPEENALLKVLSNAIESFEGRAYPAISSASKPAELIQFLLEQKGQSAKDLWEVLGGKSHVSEILSGKRPIGIKQAARLGKHFNINPAAFVRFP